MHVLQFNDLMNGLSTRLVIVRTVLVIAASVVAQQTVAWLLKGLFGLFLFRVKDDTYTVVVRPTLKSGFRHVRTLNASSFFQFHFRWPALQWLYKVEASQEYEREIDLETSGGISDYVDIRIEYDVRAGAAYDLVKNSRLIDDMLKGVVDALCTREVLLADSGTAHTTLKAMAQNIAQQCREEQEVNSRCEITAVVVEAAKRVELTFDA